MQQAISTIAHEGAHQILHNIGVQQRLSQWPMWLNEGPGRILRPTTSGSADEVEGRGQVNDLRMFEFEQYIKKPRSVERCRRPAGGPDRQAPPSSTSTGYAAAWGLTHYLAKNQRETFHALLREASQQSPLTSPGATLPPGIIPENLRSFKRHFGEDLAALERRLILYLQKLPYSDPFADRPHAVALFAIPAAGKLQRQARVFPSVEQAEAWRRGRLDETPADRRDTAIHAVREFPNRPLAEQFARQWLDLP